LFNFSSFEINNKKVCLLNLLTPFNGFIKLSTQSKKNLSKNYEKTVKEISIFKKEISLFKYISVYSFCYLLSGPVLTFYYGLNLTLILLIPFHLIALFSTVFLLFACRKKLNFTYKKILLIIFDCLMMPAYLANIVKKICAHKSFNCNGFYYSIKNAQESEKSNLHLMIRKKINEITKYC
jgi:hypothetical protein